MNYSHLKINTMWKKQARIALITSILMWALFVINMHLTGYFNWYPFVGGIIFTNWFIYCFIKASSK
jgi:hypothetical protein